MFPALMYVGTVPTYWIIIFNCAVLPVVIVKVLLFLFHFGFFTCYTHFKFTMIGYCMIIVKTIRRSIIIISHVIRNVPISHI
jgi:hypothetical protein